MLDTAVEGAVEHPDLSAAGFRGMGPWACSYQVAPVDVLQKAVEDNSWITWKARVYGSWAQSLMPCCSFWQAEMASLAGQFAIAIEDTCIPQNDAAGRIHAAGRASV